jgi:peptide/nickel transport system substrate-binding protein
MALAPQLLGVPGVYVPHINYGDPTVFLSGMNEARFPFNNRLIRLAVVHAINYTALASLFHGFGTTVVGPTPGGVLGYASDLHPYSYNLTLSKQLLAQAGYPDGKGIPPLTAWAISDAPPSVDCVTLIQAELAQIGIQVKIITWTESSEPMGYSYTDPRYPDFTIDDYGWFPDPWAFANFWVGDVWMAYGGNYADYNNTQVTNLLHQADKTSDPTQRGALYEQVAHIVYNDAPYIWIGQDYNAFGDGVPVANVNVQGYVGNIALWAGADFSLLYLVSPGSGSATSASSAYASSPMLASISSSEESGRHRTDLCS